MSAAPKLQWTRQDCGIYHNPKVLRLLSREHGAEAYASWSLSIAYSGENGLGGLVPFEAASFVRATDDVVKLLEDEVFWEHCPQGWVIHDWDDYNPGAPVAVTPEEEEAARKRSEHASKAAHGRWHPK